MSESPMISRPIARPVPPTPLQATRVDLEIRDLLATITLTQDYANREAQPIEVSYTLAIPSGATLLDLQAEIGERVLRGQVQLRAQAEERYEQALAEGHSAFAVRMVGPDLIHIALGNLLPGETLTLRIVLGQWLHWNGERVRLTLPTTIAPRYGASLLHPADQPVVDAAIEHRYALQGSVSGLLAEAAISSPTHSLRVQGGGVLRFALDACLDRDLVIDWHQASAGARAAGQMAADLDGMQVASIAFAAPLPVGTARPVVAELVIDCSGSMGGVSIEQTRQAVRAIVAQLSPADRVNVLRFGNHQELLLRRPQPATLAVQKTLLQAADLLQADLGGTELLAALEAGLDDLARVPAGVPGERVLFIISDGEVWNLQAEAFLARCRGAGVRVYAVAVGTAAVEATFAPLTRASGGALERVLPGDAMAARIERHFQRVRSGPLQSLGVRWPGEARWSELPDAIYPGDGVLLNAGLAGVEPGATAVVEWTLDGEPQQQTVTLAGSADTAPSTLARMLAYQRLSRLDAEAAGAMAVRYQLICEQTAVTLVLERAEHARADQLPELRPVSQMLAAGWGGSADLARSAPACAAPLDLADAQLCLDVSGSTGSFSPVLAPAPAARPAGPVRRAVRKLIDAVSPGPERTRGIAPVVATPADQVIAAICARLRSDPALIQRFRRGELRYSDLALALSPALFNWLDDQAAALGLELEDPTFWSRWLPQAAALGEPAAAELARLLAS
ncbi:MAG: VIT domain-containing protein [Lysobacterales bacterium]